jgi:hypothetical protein
MTEAHDMTELPPAADNTLPQAEIVPVPFGQDEPIGDRAFRCEEDGRCYRVRTARVGQPQPWAEGAVVPFIDAVEITVVRLGEDGLPERNADDQVVIVGNTRWTIDQETVSAAAGLPLQDLFWMQVRNLIHIGSRAAATPIAIDAMLANWSAAAPMTTEDQGGSVPE